MATRVFIDLNYVCLGCYLNLFLRRTPSALYLAYNLAVLLAVIVCPIWLDAGFCGLRLFVEGRRGYTWVPVSGSQAGHFFWEHTTAGKRWSWSYLLCRGRPCWFLFLSLLGKGRRVRPEFPVQEPGAPDWVRYGVCPPTLEYWQHYFSPESLLMSVHEPSPRSPSRTSSVSSSCPLKPDHFVALRNPRCRRMPLFALEPRTPFSNPLPLTPPPALASHAPYFPRQAALEKALRRVILPEHTKRWWGSLSGPFLVCGITYGRFDPDLACCHL